MFFLEETLQKVGGPSQPPAKSGWRLNWCPPDQFRILDKIIGNPQEQRRTTPLDAAWARFNPIPCVMTRTTVPESLQDRLKHRHRPSSLEKEATTMHLLSRDILFLPKKLYQCRLIVLIRKTIFLFVSAERTPVNELPFTLFEKCRDRLHQSAAGSKTVPGMYIDVPTPETLGTMIGIAIPPHLRSAPPAHKILNPFLKCFGRHIPHSFKKKQVRQPRRAPAPK